MDLGLQGRRAIVLGASRGIGRYTAELLRWEGCSLALCARQADSLAEAREALAALGPGAVFAQTADLENAAETRAFAQAAVEALGGADILIHNASGFDMKGDETGWRRSFEVDIMAGVRVVEEILPALEKSDAASITFVGSMASKYYFGRRSSYGPAKGAMRVYANELAQSLGRKGIRANAVSPGAVHFPGGSWDRVKREQPDFYSRVEKAIPLGRLGTGEELARIIVFVASPAGRWINGAHIAADGGQVAAVD